MRRGGMGVWTPDPGPRLSRSAMLLIATVWVDPGTYAYRMRAIWENREITELLIN